MTLKTRARNVSIAGVAALAVLLPMVPASGASLVGDPRSASQTAPVAPTAPAVPSAPSAAATPTVVLAGWAPKPSPTKRAARSTKASRAAARFATRSRHVMALGLSLRGVRYRYGGTTPRGFDCSGFTSYVYRKAGVSIPRTASAQRRHAKRISRSTARPGDLVFFHDRGGRVYHVGLYAGKNRVLHSPRPGKRVSTVPIWTGRVSFGRAL